MDEILRDPCASYWLKNAIRTALERDPLDAARDAEILAHHLRLNANAALHGRIAAH